QCEWLTGQYDYLPDRTGRWLAVGWVEVFGLRSGCLMAAAVLGFFCPFSGWKERVAVAATADKTVIEGLIKQNGTTIGAVLGRGTVGVAEEGSDGKMHATVRIPMDELVFEPRVLVMPHGGDLELEIINDDNNSHCAVLPNNGDAKFIWLVNFSKGRASLNLDGPGYYWYGSRTGNDEGGGLTGTIVVGGEVPDEAKLDRPPQPRP